jgi:hypothetical protein
VEIHDIGRRFGDIWAIPHDLDPGAFCCHDAVRDIDLLAKARKDAKARLSILDVGELRHPSGAVSGAGSLSCNVLWYKERDDGHQDGTSGANELPVACKPLHGISPINNNNAKSAVSNILPLIIVKSIILPFLGYH